VVGEKTQGLVTFQICIL